MQDKELYESTVARYTHLGKIFLICGIIAVAASNIASIILVVFAAINTGIAASPNGLTIPDLFQNPSFWLFVVAATILSEGGTALIVLRFTLCNIKVRHAQARLAELEKKDESEKAA